MSVIRDRNGTIESPYTNIDMMYWNFPDNWPEMDLKEQTDWFEAIFGMVRDVDDHSWMKSLPPFEPWIDWCYNGF